MISPSRTLRSPAWKRYNWRIIWLNLLYCAFLLPAVYGFKHHLILGAAAWIVAILPAIPIIGIFAAMGRYLVEEQDEYVRMLMVRQMLWAMGFTLSVATIWGFLDRCGLTFKKKSAYAAERCFCRPTAPTSTPSRRPSQS